MKSFAATVVFVVVLAFAQPVLAQPKDVNPAYQHLKQFEPLVGEWHTADGRFQYTYKWVLRKRFLYCLRQFRHPLKNESDTFEISMIGWDNEKKTLTQSEFSGGPPGHPGSHVLRRVESKGDDTWVSGRPFASIIKPRGDDYSVITLRLEKKDQLSFNATVYDSEGVEKNTFSVQLERVKQRGSRRSASGRLD